MRVLVGATVLATSVLVSMAAASGSRAQGQQPPPPPPAAGAPRAGGAPQQAPKNLQVLPKDMTIPQVQAVMRTFTAGLGVQCAYCHTGTQADRALDDKKEKLVARKMIAMLAAANDALKDVGEPAPAGTTKVTCYTCHRGTTKPLNAPPAGGGH